MASNTELENIITPIRTTFLKLENSCMWCEDPIGPVYVFDITHCFGYYSCSECKEKTKNIKNQWMMHTGLDKIMHLSKNTIKIRRTNGDIEDDWYIDTNKLYNDGIIYFDDKICIPCKNNSIFTQRFTFIDDIITLNY